MSNIIEKLAELEHKQWVEWSKNLAESEKLSSGRLERWQKLWVPYDQLSEEQKEQDRVWAYKVAQVAKKSILKELDLL